VTGVQTCALPIYRIYKECLEYAKEQKLGLPAYAFTDALMAEKVHLNLFQKALAELEGSPPQGDITETEYFTCSSCGYTFAGSEHPKNCPVCGAPADKIRAVT
jgi:rubrerythrin